MKRIAYAVLEIALFFLAIIGLHQFGVLPENSLSNASLYEAFEIGVLASLCVLILALALSALGWRNHLRTLTVARAQDLEFITRRFEQEFKYRSLYDPRGNKDA